MKLKGKSVKKIPVSKKEKMEKTLDRMVETRKQDNIKVRNTITTKLENLILEKKKAEDLVEAHKAKVKELQDTSLRIEGAIIALKEVVSNESDV